MFTRVCRLLHTAQRIEDGAADEGLLVNTLLVRYAVERGPAAAS